MKSLIGLIKRSIRRFLTKIKDSVSSGDLLMSTLVCHEKLVLGPDLNVISSSMKSLKFHTLVLEIWLS